MKDCSISRSKSEIEKSRPQLMMFPSYPENEEAAQVLILITFFGIAEKCLLLIFELLDLKKTT